MADHDQQRLIELDGNESPKVVFKVSKIKFPFSSRKLCHWLDTHYKRHLRAHLSEVMKIPFLVKVLKPALCFFHNLYIQWSRIF